MLRAEAEAERIVAALGRQVDSALKPDSIYDLFDQARFVKWWE